MYIREPKEFLRTDESIALITFQSCARNNLFIIFGHTRSRRGQTRPSCILHAFSGFVCRLAGARFN